MKFKIENKALNITNYPSIAKHFEDMASKGWLIKKIIFESIFIYKRIEPEELDFSISPYEVETMLTKKRKEEVQEFQSVSESVGWNYATKSTDFHIYFKEKGSQAIDMETDDEEEFKTIEKIGNKQIRMTYFGAFILLFLGISMLSEFRIFGFYISYIDLIKDGLMQVAVIFLPLFIILSISQTIRIKRFITINNKNIELGKEIEYSDSKYYFEKIVILIGFITMIALIVNIVYVGLILKNNRALFASVPWLIGTIIGTISRYLVKPARKSIGFKLMGFIGAIGLVIIIIALSTSAIDRMVENYNDLDANEYKVLSSDVFEYEEKLLQDTSLFVPRSYEYAYNNEDGQYIKTEYSNALTEDLAKTLVKMYIKSAKTESERYQWSKKVSIERDKENLWDLDEVYFLDYSLLNHKKIKVLIRDGKEVFYLDGKDFTDPDIIELVKNRLEL